MLRLFISHYSHDNAFEACTNSPYNGASIDASARTIQHPSVQEQKKVQILTLGARALFRAEVLRQGAGGSRCERENRFDRTSAYTAYNEVGLTQKQFGQNEKALGAFGKDIALNPKYATLYYDRSHVPATLRGKRDMAGRIAAKCNSRNVGGDVFWMSVFQRNPETISNAYASTAAGHVPAVDAHDLRGHSPNQADLFAEVPAAIIVDHDYANAMFCSANETCRTNPGGHRSLFT